MLVRLRPLDIQQALQQQQLQPQGSSSTLKLTGAQAQLAPSLSLARTPAPDAEPPPLAWLRSFGPSMNWLSLGGSFRRAGGGASFFGRSPSSRRGLDSQPSVSSARGRVDDDDNDEDDDGGGGDGGPAKKQPGGGGGKGAAGGGARGKGSTALWRLGKLVVAESRAMGTVGWGVYGRYYRFMGLATVLVLPVVVVAAQASFVAAEWWLSLWARASPQSQDDPK